MRTRTVLTLHRTLKCLYPSFPFGPEHKLEIALSDGPRWLHIESDIGVPSPFRNTAACHLHIQGELTRTLTPVLTISLVRPRMLTVSDIETTTRVGSLALDEDATAWLYVVTAFTPDVQNVELRKVWSESARSLRVSPSAQREAIKLMLFTDRELERQKWITT